MEVLLVLAIVAITAALTWPALERPLANRRLHSAADEVRTEWCQARIEAMRSGRTYAFRYEVGGDRFYTEPENGPDANASRGRFATVNSMPAAQPSHRPTPLGRRKTRRCRRASSSPVSKTSRSMTPTAGTAPTPSQDQPAGGWSDPIFFYPDGTASDIQLVLICNQSCALRVMLRGSTATATVADAGSTLE